MQVEMAVQKTKTEKTKGEKLQKKRNEQEDAEEGSDVGCGSRFFI